MKKYCLLLFACIHVCKSFAQQVQFDSLTILPFAIAKEKQLPPEELAEKKEGYYFTGIPDISQDPINGFGYGVEGSLFFNGKRTDPFFNYTPYRSQLSVALFNTTNSQREIIVGLDMPYIFNSKWRLRFETALETNPNFLYFGLTEASLNPLSYYPNNDPSQPLVNNASYHNYENSLQGNMADYNTFTKTEGVVNVSMERSFHEGRLRTLVGYEIAQINIGTPLNDSSSVRRDFDANKIRGYGSNTISLIQLGIIYDTRDLETDPTNGIFAELTHELSLKAIGSKFNFNKTFLHVNVYERILSRYFKKMVLCGSYGLGYTAGNAPFFEYPDFWSSEGDIDGLGGSKTLRGYKQARFAAPVMEYLNMELRYKFTQFKVLKQHFALSGVPFYDIGGVWNEFNRMDHTENFRYSEGLGLRVAWNVNTILRFDYAISKEDRQFFFQLGQPF